MGEVKLHDAVERMMRNSASRWPGRGARNRLEPECWPEMNPGFHLHPGSTVFTIGSCFARNVERHLEALGFEVPMRKFLAESATLQPLNDYELVTKYTPPSIYQELVWTKGIRDRDGIVTDEDIEPFLLDLGNGRFIDLQRRYQGEFGAGREEVLALRRILYGVFEKAFDCDAVVVTLGLIECWLDKETGQYVEFSDNLTQHADKNRFVFKRLTFQEAYEFTRKSIDLLGAGGKTNVLLTASPVPIMRTFTGDDVIVANTYSKSVLRAVAGQIPLIQQADIQLDVLVVDLGAFFRRAHRMADPQPGIPKRLQETRDRFRSVLRQAAALHQQQQIHVGIGKQVTPAVAAYGKQGQAGGKGRPQPIDGGALHHAVHQRGALRKGQDRILTGRRLHDRRSESL